MTAGHRRIEEFLGKFERDLAGLDNTSSSQNKSLLSNDDLPVPRGILRANLADTDPMDLDAVDKSGSSHKHCAPSDSGIGSSVGDSPDLKNTEQVEDLFGQDITESSKVTSQSAITRSIAYKQSLTGSSKPILSVPAYKHIQRFILNPVLKEKRFSPFHPLIKSVPRRVKSNEITCLRDLEKAVVYLAPRHAISKASYIGFCEFTIQCIHTTVGYLNQHDQRRPTDRPYTNGYFLDLVEQIQQYATMVSTARETRRSGKKTGGNELDYSSGEELVLEGGLGSTGRPAELVRKKKGVSVSLKTGQPFEESKPVIPSMKRALSVEPTDDSIMRSMARRKKNEPPLDINAKCSSCDRRFRRPCDLTKHEKTHTRPWKCTEPACKYFKLGWPTEKERDRHMNDKHSRAPPLFKCSFTPCTYQSKRESNCKQHMEKAHGWVYVRSKSNGKNVGRASSTITPQTPNINSPPGLEMPTPISAAAPSPYTSPYEQPTPQMSTPQLSTPSNFSVPESSNQQPMDDFQLFPDAQLSESTPFSGEYDFNAFRSSLEATDPNEYVPRLDMNLPSVASSTTGNEGLGMLDLSPLEHADLNFDMDFDNMDNDYTAMNMHQPLTPAQTVDPYSRTISACLDAPGHKIPSLSPSGQGNLMLYNPTDEGFFDSYDCAAKHTGKPTGDFTLYDTPMTGSEHSDRQSDATMIGQRNTMIPSLNSVGDDFGLPEWSGQIDLLGVHEEMEAYIRINDL